MGSRIGLRIAVLVGLLGSLVPSAASAAGCTFDLATHTMTFSAGGAGIYRSGDNLIGNGDPCVDGTTAATVTNTDLIVIDSDGGDHVLIMLTGGPLAPGFTNEPGSSDEIEISVRDSISLEIDGSLGPDSIVGGTEGFNLNAAEPDDDVDLLGVELILGPEIYSDQGDDLISLRGGSGTGDDLPALASLNGDDGNDTVLASRYSEFDEPPLFGATIVGGLGNDRLEGGPFNDSMLGYDGADVLDGFGGDDSLDGGAGLDTASFASARASLIVDLTSNSVSDGTSIQEFENVTGGPFADDLFGDANANILHGGGGNDYLDALAGTDQQFGDGGNDRIIGAAASEIVNGGPGSDTAAYSTMSTINLATGTAVGPSGSDTLASVENTSASGSPVTIVGSSGPNTISIQGTGDVSAGAGYDHVIASAAGDIIRGEDGNDLIEPGGGANNVTGGPGNDVMKLVNGDDEVLNGGTGRDRVDFSALFSSLTLDLDLTTPQATGFGTKTFIGIDDVAGTKDHDTITGNGGANSLSGGRGDDVIKGGNGNDTITGNVGEDQLFGGAGIDSVSFATTPGGVRADLAISNRQDTNVGYDTLKQFENIIGSSFADFLFGNAAANRLLGGGGKDRLSGRGGNDTLNGGPGSDSCDGGPGLDKLLSC